MKRLAAVRFGLLGGSALGAALMYWLDPQSGRRRRSVARGKVVHAAAELGDGTRVTAIDLAHRARGLVAAASSAVRHEDVSDAVLVERVRAKLGCFCSYSHAIHVA